MFITGTIYSIFATTTRDISSVPRTRSGSVKIVIRKSHIEFTSYRNSVPITEQNAIDLA